MKKLSKFEQWVKARGVTKLATELGVTRRAVHIWLSGQGTPKLSTIERIRKLSRNKITVELVLSHYVNKN